MAPRNVFGLIGVGNMGMLMAKNILAAGLELIAYDVRPEALLAVRELGASVATSPRELAHRCHVVSVIVVDDAQVEHVILDPEEGVLVGANTGTVVVLQSSIRPETCVRLSDAAAESDVLLVDAPVTGGELGAAAGSLTLLVGGAEEAVRRCQPLFEAIGGHTLHMGGVGSGMVAKIVNNLVALMIVEGTREGMRLAARAGIAEDRIIEMAGISTSNSWLIQNWSALKHQMAINPDPERLVRIAVKDLNLALSLGNDTGADLPMTSAVAAILSGTPPD